MGAIAAAVVGAGMLTGGTIMQGNAASRRKRAMQQIADTPGVDMGAAAGDAIKAIKTNQKGAQTIIADENAFNQAQRLALLEQAIPGYRELQQQRTGIARELMSGTLPKAVRNALQRKSASKAFSGGYAGGGPGTAGENLALRDLGIGTLDAMMEGAGLFGGILRDSQPVGQGSATGLIGLTGGTGVDVRSRERELRMKMSAMAVQMPGKTDVWANLLSQTGSGLLGAGMMGMGGGGGGAAGAGGSAYGFSAGSAGSVAPTWAPM